MKATISGLSACARYSRLPESGVHLMKTTPRPVTALRRARFLAPLALVAVSACAQVDSARHAALNLLPGRVAPRTAPLAAPLEAAARPAAPLSADFKARDLLTGQIVAFDATRRGGAVTVRQSDGCVWTRRGDWFAPSSAWRGCGDGSWAAGRAEVRETAALWPLTEGARGGFTRVATSATGRTFTRDTACRVTGAEAVIRESGAKTPAWVVACDDGKRTRTTWWAPGEGPVAFRAKHRKNGVEEAWVRL